MNNKAEAGIGSLILFIALVLVAAVAAGVLIQTTGSLQSKALVTAGQSQTQVSSRLQILLVWGENASVTGTLSDLYLKVKLTPGSDAIPLNKTLIQATVANKNDQTYQFSNAAGCTPTNLANASYAQNYLATGQLGYSAAGYIQEGDIVNLCMRLPLVLDSNQPLTVTVTPSGGLPTQLKMFAPDVMTTDKVQLYP